MTNGWVGSNDQSFSKIGLKVGDIVTLGSLRTSYNGDPQGGGSKIPAYYISHVSGSGSGDVVEPEPDQPATPVVGNRADFETLSRTSSYVASTSTAGWVLTNCAVQEGGEKDANPVYILLGKVAGTDTWAKAACMNGKTTAVGTIESPEIAGGCGTLSFDYANIFTEANGVNFQIEVIQNGSVVKTIVVDEDNITKMTKYVFSQDVNVSGSFKLKFTNLCPSQNTGNKDRVSIWNLVWTSYAE
jgi:hypothetical protein